ncbi:MAG: RagB/SusD family nutrient uptake outer membrane protein [Saprospiraceae bacterium]|nr:RagB/SusD family nutrient uptake outer membrane protein [Saprospiraceae bacterium]
MKKYNIPLKVLMITCCLIAFMPACTDLEEEVFSEVTADNFFQTEDELISALGAAYTSLYGYMGTTSLYAAQEVSSDEMVVPTRGPDWGDGGHWVRLHQQLWTAEDPTVTNTWNFLFGGVNSCNRLIFQFQELQNPLTDPFIAELEGLRAIYYLWLMDLYGNVPIVTSFADANPAPPTNSRAEVYNFVESALTAALPLVSESVDGTTYGRVNQMVIQMALAKLYINAEVYTGTPQWQKAAAAANAIITSGNYALENDYFANFNVDNSGSSEFILAIPYDAVFAGGLNIVMQTLSYLNQQTYDLQAQPWNGWCTLEEFYDSYEDGDLRKGEPNTEEGPSTVRSNFLVGPQWDVSGKVRLTDAGTLASGVDPDGEPFTIRKEVNELFPEAWREAGARASKFEFEIGGRPDMNNDYPVFRYADAMLIRAEALWRMDPGSAEALDLVNQIRERAGVDGFTELTAENLLAERGREVFLECHRRSDLIRFGEFTKAWWEKPASEECKELFPIPKSQTDANPNLVQNPCY